MIRPSLKVKSLPIVFIVVVFLTIIGVNASLALPLKGSPVVDYGSTYATFKLNDSYVSWYTEYNLTSEEYGKLDAFCVENQPVLNPSPYSLSLDFSNLNLRHAAILADSYFSENYINGITSQTAYQGCNMGNNV